MENVGMFYDHLEKFTSISKLLWYILLSFGIVIPFWYVVP
jgi:hypothetical protein